MSLKSMDEYYGTRHKAMMKLLMTSIYMASFGKEWSYIFFKDTSKLLPYSD